MRWSDVITLIAVIPSETNENGFALEPVEQSRTVFGNRKSVGHTEFWESQRAGIKTEIKIDVRTADYHGEELLEYAGKRCKILRAYQTGNGEYTELTLSDLPTGGGGIGRV